MNTPSFPLAEKLSVADLSDLLAGLGLKRTYFPYLDGEPGRWNILLQARKPAMIIDGELRGAEFCLHDTETVLVWTSQKIKAKMIADMIGCKVRLLDGEAELYLPIKEADRFLHGLGAKVKSSRKAPVLTPEQQQKATETLAKYREGLKVGLGTPV